MIFDLVSDLHIDHWGTNYEMDWVLNKKSNILIVAGDTSDSVDQTCEYIRKLTLHYEHVLIIDGNHEHTTQMENLRDSVSNWSKEIEKTKAHYLGHSQPVIDDTIFIGINGWWSFDFGLPNISAEKTIATGKIKSGLTDIMVKYQYEQSLIDAQFLLQSMISAQLNENIKNVVVVTHSVPHHSCISWNRYPPELDMVGCYGNSKYNWTLEADVFNKCRYWCFGHNHDAKNIPYKGMKFVSNPRGRREDWNRKHYYPLTLSI